MTPAPVVSMTPTKYFTDWTRFAWKFGAVLAIVGFVGLSGVLYLVVTRPILSALERLR